MISATLSLNNIYSLHTSLTYIYKYARTHIAALQRHSCQHGAHAHLVCTPLETLFPTFNKMGFIYIYTLHGEYIYIYTQCIIQRQWQDRATLARTRVLMLRCDLPVNTQTSSSSPTAPNPWYTLCWCPLLVPPSLRHAGRTAVRARCSSRSTTVIIIIAVLGIAVDLHNLWFVARMGCFGRKSKRK